MSRNLGEKYESLTALYLKQAGCQVIKRNYLARFGEIDLIVIEYGTLAFLEVKFRKTSGFCGPLQAVTK